MNTYKTQIAILAAQGIKDLGAAVEQFLKEKDLDPCDIVSVNLSTGTELLKLQNQILPINVLVITYKETNGK